MSLQWSQDLCAIMNIAQQTAEKLATSTSSALLLRTMLSYPSQASTLLRSLGLTEPILDSGFQHFPIIQEAELVMQRLFARAARLACSARDDEIRPIQLLLAILDEPCTARSLLQWSGIDLEFARSVLYGTVSQSSMQKIRTSQACTAQHSTTTTSNIPNNRKFTQITNNSTLQTYPNPDQTKTRSFQTNNYAPLDSQIPTLRPLNFQQSPQRQTNIHKDPITSLQNTIPQEPHNSAVQTHLELHKNNSTQDTKRTKSSGTHKRVPSARETMQSSMIDLAKKFRTASESFMEPVKSIYTKNENSPKELNNSAQLDNSAQITKNAQSHETPIEKKQLNNERTERKQNNPPARNMRQIPANNAQKTNKTTNNTPTSYVRRNGCITLSKNAFNPFSLREDKFPTLCKFGRNLLAEAKSGKLDPVIERNKEIELLVDILNKRKSNNPILLGDPGVGKTAIIEGLAIQMANDEAPVSLQNHTIIALDYGTMVSGTQLRGSIQERINAIKKEVKLANGNIILFLDELHCWLGVASGDSSADAAAELKQALTRGELACIGATTPMEFKRAINNDPAFERRFDIIEVKAPDVKTSIKIIQNGIIKQYAAHHGVEYTDEAIVSAVKLSDRFIHERTLPDKAISVLDRAGSVARRSGENSVTQKNIAEVISQIAEIPVERLLMTDNQKLLKMEEIVSKKLIGHETNITKMARVIRRNHAGFGAKRPIGSFLFLGPTGVGKTEAAKVLADFLFGSETNIVRFDMSEYMEQHSVAKLIGAPAGYVGFDEGGLLTEALRKHPYQIVLFDEIEKAHPDVMNILLQLLDEGRLTDSKGRHIDFSNTVIILTSNLGADSLAKAMRKNIGFSEEKPTISPEEAEKLILLAARKHFSPELWNRIEEKLVFHPLSQKQVESIAILLLNNSAKRLFYEKKVELIFDYNSIIAFLITHGGYAPAYGARPMRNVIQNLIESKIAEWILFNEELPEKLYVACENDEVLVDIHKIFPTPSMSLELPITPSGVHPSLEPDPSELEDLFHNTTNSNPNNEQNCELDDELNSDDDELTLLLSPNIQ